MSNETVEVAIDSGLIGNIAEQNPSAGTEVEVGSEVVVRLGAARQVSVPNLDGLTPEEAQNAAAAVGLNVDIIGTTETTDQGLDGTIASQDPVAGTTVDEGSFIQVTVYLYRPAVPDFSGMTVADAQAMATDLGLGTVNQVATVDTDNEDLNGLIESQTPLPGEIVDQGTNIDVVVYVFVP